MAETLPLTFPEISWPKISDFSDWVQSEKPSQNTSGYENQKASPSWLTQTQKTGSSLWETISPFALDWGLSALPMPFAAAYNAYSLVQSAQSLGDENNSSHLGTVVGVSLLALSVLSLFVPLFGTVGRKVPDPSDLRRLFTEYWTEANHFTKKVLAERNIAGITDPHIASIMRRFEITRGIPEPDELCLFDFISNELKMVDPHEEIREVLEVIPGLGAHSIALARAGRFENVILADRKGEFSEGVGSALRALDIRNVTQHTIPDLTPRNVREVGMALPLTPHVLMVRPTTGSADFKPEVTLELFLSALGQRQTPRQVLFFDDEYSYDYTAIMRNIRRSTGQTWEITQQASDEKHHLVVFENIVEMGDA